MTSKDDRFQWNDGDVKWLKVTDPPVVRIVSARITEQPKEMFDPMPQVWVTLHGVPSEQFLFSYFPDEIQFHAEEFVGMTLDEAKSLKGRKDRAWLKSE